MRSGCIQLTWFPPLKHLPPPLCRIVSISLLTSVRSRAAPSVRVCELCSIVLVAARCVVLSMWAQPALCFGRRAGLRAPKLRGTDELAGGLTYLQVRSHVPRSFEARGTAHHSHQRTVWEVRSWINGTSCRKVAALVAYRQDRSVTDSKRCECALSNGSSIHKMWNKCACTG